VVHPQPVLTFSIFNGAGPLFFTINEWVTLTPSTTGLNSKRVSGKKADGEFEALLSMPNEMVVKKRMQNARAKKEKVLNFICKIL